MIHHTRQATITITPLKRYLVYTGFGESNPEFNSIWQALEYCRNNRINYTINI